MIKANDLVLVHGISVSADSDSLTHLQFADNIIVFLEPSTENILNLRNILQCFQLTSGLKINLEKSLLYMLE